MVPTSSPPPRPSATIASLRLPGNDFFTPDQFVDTNWKTDGRAAEAGETLRLARGVVHEFLGADAGGRDEGAGRTAAWAMPLILLSHLAGAAQDESQDKSQDETQPRRGDFSGQVAWVGRSLWPHPELLTRGVLERSLWVALPGRETAQRLWAADLLMRCGAFSVVLVDASGFDMAATKRLQLAARVGLGLCVLARPPNEEKELSAAASRWRVRTVLSSSSHPRWSVTLLRNKNAAVRLQDRPVDLTVPFVFNLEFDRVAGGLCVPTSVVHQPAATAPAASSGRRRHTA